jgi:hypothetical protein
MKRILLITVLIAGFGVNQSEAQFLKELKIRHLKEARMWLSGKQPKKAADKNR